jgi:hypothetical protein
MKLPVILIVFILFASCKKENEENTHGSQYGPGDLVFSPGIEAIIDTDNVHFDYTFSRMTDFESGYDHSDSSIKIARHFLYGPIIYFKGSKICLEQELYPKTFYPGLNNHSTSWFRIELVYNNITYTTLPNDTTQFYFTLTDFLNDTLSGTFGGKLYQGTDSTNFVNISNGQFNIGLKVFN